MSEFRVIVDDGRPISEMMKCPYCKETFQCTEYPQTPGFRFKEDLTCPYCNKVIDQSMEYEYYTRRL